MNFSHQVTSGYGDANDLKHLLVIDAGTEFKLYSLDSHMSFIKSFPTTTEGEHYRRQVTFGEAGGVIVGGSKEGVIHVFDTKTGVPLNVLHHTPKTKVLAVTVCGLQTQVFFSCSL
jgi:WD40 repeat protein